jgi:peptide chain release factor 3
MKSKQLDKGVRQLTDEGVAQLFLQRNGNKKYIGTVGNLQFEVIQYRLKHEYGASCTFHRLNFYKACWITSDKPAKLKEFCQHKANYIVTDKNDNLIFLAQSAGVLSITRDNYPDIQFHFTSEFAGKKASVL